MPTFSDPQSLTATAGTTVFTFQNAKTIGKSYVQTWKDLVAPAATAPVLKSKYDESHATLVRGVVQVTIPLPIVDGSLKPFTVNVSSVGHKEHANTDALRVLELALAALAVSGVKTKFLSRI